MTPSARAAAAIEVLDRVLGGAAAEQALVNWGRASRYAGSGDRAAVRDLVFDALRCRRSFAALGGGLTGRGLVLGGLRAAGGDEGLFSGAGHAPGVIGAGDEGREPEGAEALDCPDWLWPVFAESLGAEAADVLGALRMRAPVFLRVNLLRGTVDAAVTALAEEGIGVILRPDVTTALEVTDNARKIQKSASYLTGLVELQDLSSQAVVAALPLRAGMRVLDYCAGGGGKTLAMAARLGGPVEAHDANARRMADLAPRAARAGAEVRVVAQPQGHYDLVLADAPCSGSGSWRRDPQGKWALTAEKLAAVQASQVAVLDAAARLVGPKGVLAYATCSLFQGENQGQIAAFLARHPGWREVESRQWTPLSGGDGFFLSMLTRKES
ncbi:MAG: RsmB/NOP family class I SAM-dependent RNA methyltransferase [Paracoccaceae bacterium]